jgi:hypothetical protein
MTDVLPSPLEKNIADVLPSSLDNFGLELCSLSHKLYQKTWGHMLMTKIGRVAILPARSIRPVSQISQISPLYKFIWLV